MEYPDVPSPSPSPPPSPTLDRPPSPELPLTMAASAVLTGLPRDAGAALASAGNALFAPDEKVVVRFKAVGSAPPLVGAAVRRIRAAQRFEAVVLFLRRALRVAPADGLFLYVNSAFAPSLDEVVGNLHKVRETTWFPFVLGRFPDLPPWGLVDGGWAGEVSCHGRVTGLRKPSA
jgi:ubiquitin-like protein ATG12